MARKSEILSRLQAIAAADDGSGKGTMGDHGPIAWVNVRNGEFTDGTYLALNSDEASEELNRLVRSGKVKIHVRKDELYLKLA